MNGHSRFWFHVEHSSSFSFRVSRPITVGSIYVELRPKTEGEGDGAAAPCGRYILWAKCVTTNTVADGLLCDQPPYVVASFNLNAEGTSSTTSSLGWEIGGDSRVFMSLTKPSEPMIILEESDMNSPVSPADDVPGGVSKYKPSTSPHHALNYKYYVTVTLVGVKAEWDFEESIWKPLLCFRWFELQEHISEARRPVLPLTKYGKRLEYNKEHKKRMIAGDVKEASAVSSCGNYVLWKDGSLGLRRELIPYHRVFTPSREDKCVRVRKFPHRFADVVGEIPFGSAVEVIGRQMDKYTKEEYALVILSGTSDAAIKAETCELQYIEPNKWMWGWSKITSSSSLSLLTELHEVNKSSQSDQGHVEQLNEPTYYTSVREERSVRIRNGPSLSADVVGHLEPNEVKVAIALHHLPVSQSGKSLHSLQHFVEWKEGGFSLLRNNDRVYLVPVHLHKELRHFPVCPLPTPNSPDIIPLSRKRRRSVSPCNYESRGDSAPTPSQDLLSPSAIPKEVAAGLSMGSVRLEDLPIVDHNGSSTRSSSSSNVCY